MGGLMDWKKKMKQKKNIQNLLWIKVGENAE